MWQVQHINMHFEVKLIYQYRNAQFKVPPGDTP